MSSTLAFEPERMDIEKYIQENGGQGTTALLPHDKANVVIGHYRDAAGKHCEIAVTITHDGMDIWSSSA